MIKHVASRVAFRVSLLAVALSGAAACSHQAPTIAHTHIGHAMTAFQGAPQEKSLFAVAEERAQEAATQAAAAAEARDLTTVKVRVAETVRLSGGEDYGLKQALYESVKHLNFAATSDDASANVQRSAGTFEAAASDVLNRCDLIALLASDVVATDSIDEAKLIAEQIRTLAAANLDGGASNDVGVVQLRTMIEDMIAREDPPYETVDRWYLFHLVRLPDCETCWAWRKWANPSNRGY